MLPLHQAFLSGGNPYFSILKYPQKWIRTGRYGDRPQRKFPVPKRYFARVLHPEILPLSSRSHNPRFCNNSLIIAYQLILEAIQEKHSTVLDARDHPALENPACFFLSAILDLHSSLRWYRVNQIPPISASHVSADSGFQPHRMTIGQWPQSSLNPQVDFNIQDTINARLQLSDSHEHNSKLCPLTF